LLTDGGVSQRPRTDLTGDHLAGIQAHSQLQVHAVKGSDVNGQQLRRFLKAQGRQTGTNGVVLQRHRRAEHGHDAVAGELVHRAPVALHHHHRAIDEVGHDLSQALSTDRRSDLHRMNNIGEQDRHLLVFRRLRRLRQLHSALAAELGRRARLRAAGTADQRRRGQSAAIPREVHVSIVSPVVSYVRRFAVSHDQASASVGHFRPRRQACPPRQTLV